MSLNLQLIVITNMNKFGSHKSMLINQISDATYPMLVQLVTSLGNFIISLIIIRALGMNEFGFFTICFLLILVSREIFSGIFLTPMSVLYHKFDEGNIYNYKGFLLCYLVIIMLFFSCCIYAASFMLHKFGGIYIVSENIRILILAFCVISFSDFLKRYFLINSNGLYSLCIEALRFFIIIFYMIYLVNMSELEISKILWILFISALTSSILFLPKIGFIEWSSIEYKNFYMKHSNFQKWMGLSVILKAAQSQTPQFLLLALLGELYLGIYRSCQQIANIINLPLNGIVQTLSAKGAIILKNEGSNFLEIYLKNTTIFLFFILVPTSIFIALFNESISSFLNIQNEKIFYLLILLLISNLFVSFRLQFLTFAEVNEKPKLISLSFMFSLIVGFPLSYLLINNLGLTGAGVSSIIFVILSTILLYRSKKKADIML